MEVCTVTDTYECGNSYLVIWDVYHGMRILYSVSFQWNNLIGTNYTANINNIIIYTELTDINWRASVASETLTGVTQSKIGDVYLFIYWRASVASETVLGVDNAKSGICYIYYICRYVCMDCTYAL